MRIAAGILLVVVILGALPYLLYWLLWLLTGRGLPAKERKETPKRAGQVKP